MSYGGGSSGSGSIHASSDVALSNPADGQVLTYSASLSKWQNAAATGGATINDASASGSSVYSSTKTNTLLAAKADLTAGTIALSIAAPGTTFVVSYDGTNWKYASATITTRPSARTDLTMMCLSDGTVPSFAISGDILFKVP